MLLHTKMEHIKLSFKIFNFSGLENTHICMFYLGHLGGPNFQELATLELRKAIIDASYLPVESISHEIL